VEKLITYEYLLKFGNYKTLCILSPTKGEK
jgi:hypothetical protein